MSHVGSRFQEFYAEKWCATKSKNLPSTFTEVTNVTSMRQVTNSRAVWQNVNYHKCKAVILLHHHILLYVTVLHQDVL